MSIFSKIWARRVAESEPGGFDCRFGAIKFDPRDQAELEKKRMILQDDRVCKDMDRELRTAINDPLLPL